MRILFLKKRSLRVYDPKKHAEDVLNFLYWEQENILLIGDGDYSKDTSHKSLLAQAKKCCQDIPNAIPDGAGDCIDKKVLGWISGGFDVMTPFDLRTLISEALFG
ncbi:MAG: hypothetical protein PHP62_03980 [Candidatus Moranbacteria bacterium]|nr:hypothetical protein [Candidatus Moranbacteria bacterium]